MFFVMLLAALAFPVAVQHVDAAEFRCQTANAGIVAEDSRDAVLACEGIDSALHFLKAQGLDVDADIQIEIVQSIAGGESRAIAGHFDRESNKAVILSYDQFVKLITWLKVPITASLYRGVAAHETAHIIALQNFRVAKPTIQAQEYIAYVTTLATLPPGQQARVMAEYPGDGYDTDQQMNTTIYLCDPMRFGVEAYRHFVKRGKDEEYFRKILNGEVLRD